jgi:hypothetical protein
VDVQAAGAFRPGQPIQLVVTGNANLGTGDAELRVVLPEVAAARASSWDQVLIPVGEPMTPEVSVRGGMGRGTSVQRTATVTIPRPGYYRVVASVQHRDPLGTDEWSSDERLVQDVAHKTLWLWIDEKGGRVTSEFDPSLFPAGEPARPGPRGALLVARPDRAPRSAGGANLQTTGVAGYVYNRHIYYNNDVSAYEPVPNAAFEYLIFNSAGTQVAQRPGVTDASGWSSTACYTGGRYRLRLSLDNARVTMDPAISTDVSGYFSTECGLAYNAVAPAASYGNERAHVFVTLTRAVQASDAFFARQRADIRVRVSTAQTYSTYLRTNDELVYLPSTVWGVYGAFVTAHEYGHAFHETALGGFARYRDAPASSGICNIPHPIETKDGNMQCALPEGFATYFSVATLGTRTGYIRDQIENAGYSPGGVSSPYAAGDDGSRIEGAIASYLYDITDPANETHDAVSYPGSYVADIIRTCRAVRTTTPTYNILNDGVDHLTYCFQQAVLGTNLFPTRASPPQSFQEQAAEPAGWSQSALVRLRDRNLFGR